MLPLRQWSVNISCNRPVTQWADSWSLSQLLSSDPVHKSSHRREAGRIRTSELSWIGEHRAPSLAEVREEMCLGPVWVVCMLYSGGLFSVHDWMSGSEYQAAPMSPTLNLTSLLPSLARQCLPPSPRKDASDCLSSF